MEVKRAVYKELIREDKHGNRIYRTNKCRKCYGTGRLVCCAMDNGRCWRCMGTGIEDEYKTTEYTPEQLRLRLAKKTVKRIGTVEQQLRAMGFSQDGVAYIPIGNTFPVKDEIKAAGGVYDRARGWVSPVPLDFIECRRVEAKDVLKFTDYAEGEIKWTVVHWKRQE